MPGPAPTPHSGHAYPFSKHPGQACPHEPSCTPTSVTREPPASHVWSAVLSPSASLQFHPAAIGRGGQRGPSLQGLGLTGPPLPTHPPTGKFTASKTQSSPFDRQRIRGTERMRGTRMGCPDSAAPQHPTSASYHLCGYAPGLTCQTDKWITIPLRVSRSI